MRTRLALGFRLQVGLGCWLALAACSGDDKKSQSSGDAGAEDGGKSSAAGSGGSGGKGTGSGKEGAECSSNADCGSSLSCLKADAHVEDLKVCARPCTKTSDCKDDERCWSATGDPENAFCWNTVGEALKQCGPAFTSLCDDAKSLGCLRVEDDNHSVAGGVCLTPCKLKESGSCEGGLTCLDIIDDPDSGLCVRTIKRGDTCDEPKGEFCEPGNLCLSDGDVWRCYQDCTDSKKCDDDKQCKMLKNDSGAYCD